MNKQEPKPIEIIVYGTGKILGVFKSTRYVTDNSKILFGKEHNVHGVGLDKITILWEEFYETFE